LDSVEPEKFRFRSDQRELIADARLIRHIAGQLRNKVAGGNYTDDDLKIFWEIANTAGTRLVISNLELAERAGVGDRFFASVGHEKRRPKLTNFLKALTAVIEVADERLSAADQNSRSNLARVIDNAFSRPQPDIRDIILLSVSLSRLAQDEIEKLDGERPNDTETIELNNSFRDVLEIFRDGFIAIAESLDRLTKNSKDPELIEESKSVLRAVTIEFEQWWKKNSQNVVDWSWRIPFLTSGVAALNLAGADMTIGTAAMAALVGGDKLAKTVKSVKQ